ncbi:MAG: peptidoglycan D,D-transpeptidase FtsI family protein [Bacillaceae bacterium]
MAKKRKNKNHLPFRLNVLFFLVFLCFSILIIRLGVIQIVKGETYKREVEQQENVTVNASVPRGKILDRNQKVVVDNEPINAITYTRLDGVSNEERFEIAYKLSKIIDKKTDKVTERDKKDYWILKNKKAADAKVTKEEMAKLQKEESPDDAIYDLKLSRITEEDLATITPEELEVLAIKREMDSGYKGTPQIIKSEGLTDKEYAIVSENLQSLPGVDITTDWKRKYPFGESFRAALGGITSSDEGLPKDKLPYYDARDYSRNDRVGKSYIEAKYEDILNGKKEKVKNITDEEGNIIGTEVVSEGRAGQDVVLTIDMELQSQVDKIIEEELLAAKSRVGNDLVDRAFVVMLNPKTGEVLSMNGKQIQKNKKTGKYEFVDFSIGAMTTAYPMGSVVKGATILTGFETGVIQPGKITLDAPMQFKGSKPKKSWKDLGVIDDLTALQRSSNVYMFDIALRILGTNYKYGMTLPINEKAFDTMRYYFNQFGLGVSTGIDLPNESVGYIGTDTAPYLLLDYAIGQYDSYTALQLAQYVSTIANDGYRMKAQILKEVREPVYGEDEAGKTVEITHPEVLNRVDMKDEYIKRVQEGFRRVTQVPNGTLYAQFNDSSHNPAGKSGTAEAFYEGQSVYNVTAIGYAPMDNPEIAFSVVVPHTRNDKDVINKIIGRRAMDAYFDLQKERSQVTDKKE